MNRPIDFDRLRAVAIDNAHNLVQRWLPDGKAAGNEWKATNPVRSDRSPGSFSINMQTGLWSDFATGDKGGILELYGYLHGESIVNAAHAVAADLGLQPTDYLKHAPRRNSAASSRALVPIAEIPKKKLGFTWLPICPVPADAPPPPTAHYKRGKPDVRWSYFDQSGELLGSTERHNTSDGGKEILVLTYGKHEKFGTGWQYRQWAEPRPLYGLWQLGTADTPVLVVEGEKCRDAAAALLDGAYAVVSWPGGCNAVSKVDWAPLANRRLVLWPDCDAQQNKERTALLPRAQQPGEISMQAIAARLVALGCQVQVMNVGEPGSRAAGWDVADASSSDGWDAAAVKQFIADTACDAVPPGADEKSAPMSSPDEGVPVDYVLSREAKSPATAPAAAPSATAQEERDDFPFSTNETGTYYHGGIARGNKPMPPFKISGPIWVGAHTQDKGGASWAVHGRYLDRAGVQRPFSILMSMMAGDASEMRQYLMDGGFAVGATSEQKSLLSRFLQEHPVRELALGVTTVGWHGQVYVLPNKTIGQTAQRILFQSEGRPLQSRFSKRGTAEEWRQHVGRYCIGNSRLLLSVSIAFASVLLKHSGEGGGGVAFYGLSGGGKTTSQHVACSVLGSVDFKHSWNTTATALEAMATQHCDSLLVLDEMGVVDAKILGETIYQLANGIGKARGSRDARLRPLAEYRIFFFSSAEVTVRQHMATAGKTTQLGQELRLLEIKADAGAGFGAFENLHGTLSGDHFAKRLEAGFHRCYGVVGYEFIQWAVREVETLPTRVRGFIETTVNAWLPPTASAQAKRAARRFALIAAGGEFASHLTGWPAGEATRGVHRCFQDWLDARGGDGNGEARQIMRRVQLWVGANVSRFQGWHQVSDGRVKTINRAGWRRFVTDGGDVLNEEAEDGPIGRKTREQSSSEYLVMAEVFRSEVCAELDFKAVLRELDKRGHLRRFSPDALGYRARPPGESHVQVYVIRASVLGDDDV